MIICYPERRMPAGWLYGRIAIEGEFSLALLFPACYTCAGRLYGQGLHQRLDAI